MQFLQNVVTIRWTVASIGAILWTWVYKKDFNRFWVICRELGLQSNDVLGDAVDRFYVCACPRCIISSL